MPLQFVHGGTGTIAPGVSSRLPPSWFCTTTPRSPLRCFDARDLLQTGLALIVRLNPESSIRGASLTASAILRLGSREYGLAS